MHPLRTLLSVAVALTLTPAWAATNLLSNGSFESATSLAPNSTLEPGATNLTGWTVIGGGNLIWCDSGSYCVRPASDGNFSLDLTGLTNVSPYAGVSQTVATVSGARYELSFDLAGRSDSFPVSVLAHANATSASFTNPGADWSVYTMSFVADAAQTVVSIVGVSAGGTGVAIELDNVRLMASAVPEPAAWALLLGGLAMVHAMRRRAQAGR